jgi:hypothetical protein
VPHTPGSYTYYMIPLFIKYPVLITPLKYHGNFKVRALQSECGGLGCAAQRGGSFYHNEFINLAASGSRISESRVLIMRVSPIL